MPLPVKSTLPALLALLVASSAVADSVRLHSTVHLPDDATVVRLGDIADLQGDEALRLADLTIVEVDDPTAFIEIPLSLVRERLHEAGAHRGRLNVNGRSVTVHPRERAGASTLGAMAGASLARTPKRPEAPAREERMASQLVPSATLGGRIARDIVRAFDTDAEHVRLVFNDGDLDLLELSEHDAQFEIVPGSSLRTDRVTLTVRRWVNGSIDQSHTITFRPIVRRTIILARAELPRGHAIEQSDLETQARWLPPSRCNGPTRFEELVGRITTRRVAAGAVLSEKHARRRTVIERGDRVIVRCLVGGVVLSMKAQAREDGATGDTIQLQRLGERTTFLGTVVRRGEAVVQLTRPGA